MKKRYGTLLFIAIAALHSCKKSDTKPDNINSNGKKIVEIVSYYQRYSFGELSSVKNEWEKWVYDTEGRISRTSLHYDYNYNGISGILIPDVTSYAYNDDGTIKSTSDRNFVYRYEYNASKQNTKMERWSENGLSGKEEYEYEDGRHILTKEYQSYDLVNHWREIHIEYNSNDQVLSKTYKQVDELEPSLRYTYEYDKRGSIIKRTQHSLDRGTSIDLETYRYDYNSNGSVKVKHEDKATQPYMYEITYEYDTNGLKVSEHIKRKDSYNDNPYEDWMFITYEHEYN